MQRRAQLVAEADDIIRGIEALQTSAFDAFSPHNGRPFVPQKSLRNYLTVPRIKVLLRSYDLPSRAAENIRNYYLRVLAILLEIGKAKHVLHFLPHDGLADDFLPFDELHKNKWPSNSRKFFDKFYDAQWKFCAQQLKTGRLDNKRIDPNRILPFTTKACLKSGPDSEVLKVDVHPEYNDLVPKVCHLFTQS